MNRLEEIRARLEEYLDAGEPCAESDVRALLSDVERLTRERDGALAAELAALRSEHAAVVADREALRRVVLRLLAGRVGGAAWLAECLRSEGDEPGAVAVERALGGAP